MECWIKAILISKQTAREAKVSLTGAVKNIAKIISLMDINKDIENVEPQKQNHTLRHMLGDEIKK